MLMPKKNRVAIYELLFKEGVMVAKKDVHLAKHPELADKNVPNLHVMKAMQSLKSCGYVKEQFAWRHFYWYLTNEGIQYLRDFLHLPPEIVPATLRRQTRPETARPRPKGRVSTKLQKRPVLRERDRLVWPVARETEMLTDVLQLSLVQTRRLRLVQVQPQNSSLEVVLAVAEDNHHSNFPHYLYNKGSKVLVSDSFIYWFQVLICAFSVIFNALKELFI